MTTATPGTLTEILKQDGPALIRAAYQEILQREPDHQGLTSHAAALAKGVSKARILASIADSDEAVVNGMATSQLARAAWRRAFLEHGGLLKPFRPLVAPFYEKHHLDRIASRRAALTQVADDAPASAPAPVRQNVERVRSSLEAWQGRIESARKHGVETRSGNKIGDLWFDLTTTLEWRGGVVGIIRAELEIAHGLAKAYPDLRFSMQLDQGFCEITRDELSWLIEADNVVDAYMRFFGRYKDSSESAKTLRVEAPDVEGFFHPYKNGDAVIAVGWMDSQKERYFSLVKDDLSEFFICYLVYDIILLLPETRHFYHIQGRDQFERYIEWISTNCDLVFYGGRTAQIDTEALQKEKGWRTPPGVPVKFGTDIVRLPDASDDDEVLKRLGIDGEYFITVGSLEPRKNHETLYRAYLLALENSSGNLPQMVFIGKPAWRIDDLVDAIARDPRIRGKLLCLTPTDIELAILYKHCRFTALPSLYEGWSLTLPESLGQGKFCLCADTPPLREIGGDLVDYVDTFDVRAWAEKMAEYSTNDGRLTALEARIRTEWPVMTWADTSNSILDAVMAFDPTAQNTAASNTPVVWMDLTLSYLDWSGGISGIVRSELEFAKQLKTLDPRTKFFAYQRNGSYFFEIDQANLLWLFEEGDLSAAYTNFHNFWFSHEGNATGYRDPFMYPASGRKPTPGHTAFFGDLPRNSIVLFAGIDFDLSRVRTIGEHIRPNRGILRSQIIYDLTPLITPQFHLAPTCDGFSQMFDYVSDHFEHLVYGGRTAQRDGTLVQRERGLNIPPSSFVEFGSDIGAVRSEPISNSKDADVLRRLGIDADFAITVGTIEPRKNHEALYKAYLTMLQKDLLDRPFQIVFVGKPGWKTDDFLASFEADDRVRGKILVMSPSDEELDVLYRNCRFTLLPSFYEGWSLTLPESLSYGKLCLTSDVDPLRETGRDLVEYIHPLDTARWAERIAHYANHPDRLVPWEKKIAADWKARTWAESAAMLLDGLRTAQSAVVERQSDGELQGERA